MVKGISKNDFCDLLNLVTKELFFIFSSNLYVQIDSVAMWSPVVQILSNIFLSHHENSLNKCPIEFKPRFFRRCVDDIFLLFESPEPAHSLHKYMSSKDQNVNFAVERENFGLLSFLDLKCCPKNYKCVTSVYKKPIFRGVFNKRGDFYTHYFIRVLAYAVK